MNWEYLIKMFDILGAIGIILSLNLILRYYRMWLVYTFSTILFIIAQTYAWRVHKADTFGAVLMGIILLFTGLRNYRKENKKNR